AFLAAARAGDFDALIEVLDPDVVFRIDTRTRDREAIEGAEAVAAQILTRGQAFAPLGRPAIVNGGAGVIVMPGDRPIAVVGLTVRRGGMGGLDVRATPETLRSVTARKCGVSPRFGARHGTEGATTVPRVEAGTRAVRGGRTALPPPVRTCRGCRHGARHR